MNAVNMSKSMFISEIPYVSVLFYQHSKERNCRYYLIERENEILFDSFCFSCFQPLDSDHSDRRRCPACDTICYCCDECQLVDSLSHQFECIAFQRCTDSNLLNDSDALMVGRVLTKLHFGQLYPPSSTGNRLGQLEGARSFNELMTHSEERFNCEENEQTLQSTFLNFKKLYENVAPIFTLSDLEMRVRNIFGAAETNTFSVIKDDLMGPLPIGYGLYLNISRFDHSCTPDLIRSFDGNVIRLTPNPEKIVSVSKILSVSKCPWQQLTVSYCRGGPAGNMKYTLPTMKDITQFLSGQFHFACQCEKCTDSEKRLIQERSLNPKICPCNKSGVLKHDKPHCILIGHPVIHDAGQAISGDSIYCLQSDIIFSTEKVDRVVSLFSKIERTLGDNIATDLQDRIGKIKRLLGESCQLFDVRHNLQVIQLREELYRCLCLNPEISNKVKLQHLMSLTKPFARNLDYFDQHLAYHYAEVYRISSQMGLDDLARRTLKKIFNVWTCRLGRVPFNIDSK